MKKCWGCGDEYTQKTWGKVYKKSNICPECCDTILYSNVTISLLNSLKKSLNYIKKVSEDTICSGSDFADYDLLEEVEDIIKKAERICTGTSKKP